MDSESAPLQQSQVATIQDPDPLSEILYARIEAHNRRGRQRSDVDTIFNHRKHTDPDTLCLELANLFHSSSSSPKVRSISGTLLSKLLTFNYNDSSNSNYVWPRLTPQTQTSIKSLLLSSLQSLGTLLRFLNWRNDFHEFIHHNHWIDLLPFMLQCLSPSDPPELVEYALVTYGQLLQYVWRSEIVVYPYQLSPGQIKNTILSIIRLLKSPTINSNVQMAGMDVFITLLFCLLKSWNDHNYAQYYGFFKAKVLRGYDDDIHPVIIEVLRHQATLPPALRLDVLIKLLDTGRWSFLGWDLAKVVRIMLRILESGLLDIRSQFLVTDFMIRLACKHTPEEIKRMQQSIKPLTQLQPFQLAAIMGPDQTPFETLISDLMSSANDKRFHAETLFNICKLTNPNTLSLKLVRLLSNSCSQELRAMSAILLRKQLAEECWWRCLNPNTLSSIKSLLLSSLGSKPPKFVMKMLCDTILELASIILPDNGWPELFSLMVYGLRSHHSPELQESAFIIFTRLLQYMSIADFNRSSFEELRDIFYRCFISPRVSNSVRAAALVAFIKFLLCPLESMEQSLWHFTQREMMFQPLVPLSMWSFTRVLSVGSELVGQDALRLLIVLAQNNPSFFHGHLGIVRRVMMGIAGRRSLGEETRYLAIELVTTLGGFTDDIINDMIISSSSFAMLSDIEDDLAEETINYSVAREFLGKMPFLLVMNVSLLVRLINCLFIWLLLSGRYIMLHSLRLPYNWTLLEGHDLKVGLRDGHGVAVFSRQAPLCSQSSY